MYYRVHYPPMISILRKHTLQRSRDDAKNGLHIICLRQSTSKRCDDIKQTVVQKSDTQSCPRRGGSVLYKNIIVTGANQIISFTRRPHSNIAITAGLLRFQNY